MTWKQLFYNQSIISCNILNQKNIDVSLRKYIGIYFQHVTFQINHALILMSFLFLYFGVSSDFSPRHSKLLFGSILKVPTQEIVKRKVKVFQSKNPWCYKTINVYFWRKKSKYFHHSLYFHISFLHLKQSIIIYLLHCYTYRLLKYLYFVQVTLCKHV